MSLDLSAKTNYVLDLNRNNAGDKYFPTITNFNVYRYMIYYNTKLLTKNLEKAGATCMYLCTRLYRSGRS